jgi:hypothetical protein
VAQLTEKYLIIESSVDRGNTWRIFDPFRVKRLKIRWENIFAIVKKRALFDEIALIYFNENEKDNIQALSKMPMAQVSLMRLKDKDEFASQICQNATNAAVLFDDISDESLAFWGTDRNQCAQLKKGRPIKELKITVLAIILVALTIALVSRIVCK